jgi:lactoylglutathione lyase
MKALPFCLAGVLLLSAGCGHEPKANSSQWVVPRVGHILLEVKDLDRSVKFYRDELGLKLEKRSKDFAVLESANVGVYLWSKHWDWSPPPPAGPRPPQGMYPHLVFSDVKGLVERLRRDGYRIVAEPKDHIYGTEAFVADPDGFVWALISR